MPLVWLHVRCHGRARAAALSPTRPTADLRLFVTFSRSSYFPIDPASHPRFLRQSTARPTLAENLHPTALRPGYSCTCRATGTARRPVVRRPTFAHTPIPDNHPLALRMASRLPDCPIPLVRRMGRWVRRWCRPSDLLIARAEQSEYRESDSGMQTKRTTQSDRTQIRNVILALLDSIRFQVQPVPLDALDAHMATARRA